MNETSDSSPALVIDASTAVWAILPEMQAGGLDAASLLARWTDQGIRLLAPNWWLAEAASGIRMAVHHGRITSSRAREAMTSLFTLEVEMLPLDEPIFQTALDWAAKLGQARAYDSLYLALAEQLGVDFWTADRWLANSAQQAGASWAHWIREES